ncbi:hypothetical protein LWC34_12840 [Kibdelosporangium philippinense]|uniref:Uncharacterized protein n=1 Tax=Kibdelosporangium philippinense TaxID=211113 RepID=A0ABS8Z742_9PSEU|nr:hypothetical protein [Kibdelosporangium philippinense]MCE7003706.1 hypothetical protein [Kibdelosporangium philippinense]
MHSEILEGARLRDVFEELGTVAGDSRSLHDEVFGEELVEALDIAELVGVDVVVVELLEDRQVFGGLLGVVDFPGPSLLFGRSLTNDRVDYIVQCMCRKW